jgi:hypothetical protein
MTQTEKLKSFFEKYYIKVLNDTKRFARCRPLQYRCQEKDIDSIQNIEIDYEPLLTVEIPLSKLEHLMTIENMFFNNIDEVHSRRMFEHWMDQQRDERYLHEKYPGVKDSYDQYITILNLCRENPKKIKDL